jgi:dolichol-phosphate mannosyltransferase
MRHKPVTGATLTTVDVSVIIPTVNESENISQLLFDLHDGLARNGLSHEVIVVDDDSTDDTAVLVRQMSTANSSIKLLSRLGRRGIGSAIFEGFLRSTGQIIVTMDADFSHPPEAVHTLVHAMGQYDVAVGSRYMPGGTMHAPLSRRLLSLLLNKALRRILSLTVHDCTGGFIALKRTVFDAIGEIKAKSGDFSFEIIYKSTRAGFTLTEIPFVYRWRITGKSKTNIVKFGWEYLHSALTLKLHSV